MMAAALIARASTQRVVEDRGRVPEGHSETFSQIQFLPIINRIIERRAMQGWPISNVSIQRGAKLRLKRKT